MSVLVDHELRSHPKWLALTDTQRARLVEAWMWIDEQGTDGHVPGHIPKALGIRPKDLAALEELAWLDRNGDGWHAHDWHDMNPPVDPEARKTWFRRRRQRRPKIDTNIDA